jgi:thiol-disulfide isomerase/thioredoxin
VSKPIVDGLKDDLQGQADVIYLDLMSNVGRASARTYGVKVVPTLLVFDGSGEVVLRETGLPDAGAIRDAVAALASE